MMISMKPEKFEIESQGKARKNRNFEGVEGWRLFNCLFFKRAKLKEINNIQYLKSDSLGSATSFINQMNSVLHKLLIIFSFIL